MVSTDVVKNNYDSDLEKLRLSYPNNVSVCFLNINSIRNKVNDIMSFINKSVDIIILGETKIDSSFPISQFAIDGYKTPYRLDVSHNSGGVLVYVNENIPSRILNRVKIPEDIQVIPFELNLRKRKWLILAVYKPPNQSHDYFFRYIKCLLDNYLCSYNDFLIIGDFNLQPNNKIMQEFFQLYQCNNLVKEPTCFKSVINPSCIDLIITNRKMCFQHTKTFCTGISDHHQLVYTMFKSTFKKLQPKKYYYRSFKNFQVETFSNQLALGLRNCHDFTLFNGIFSDVLNFHAPLKTKILRGNHKPFVTKELRKAIMVRSKLKRISQIVKTEDSIRKYKEQRNRVVNLNKKAKVNYFKNNNIDNNKASLWNICKPFLSEKSGNSNERIFLVENDEILSDNLILANTFNSYFTNIVSTLKVAKVPSPLIFCSSVDPIESIICKYSTHESVVKIKNHIPKTGEFRFKPVTPNDVTRIINAMNKKKKTSGDIPTHVLKSHLMLFKDSLTDCINNSLFDSDFPSCLKLADITPCFKSGDTTSKSNYRPISILASLSKVFEKIIYEQIMSFIEPKLNRLLCGFRKKHGTQHALFLLIKRWQDCIDKGGIIGSLLMDLSKAYDCIPHDLLIAKLEAYGFSHSSLKLIYSYLTDRKQRVKLGSTFSEWLEIILGVPQGSILGPLLFNIFINDLFLFIVETEICNFADDNTLYACDTSVENVLNRLNNEASRTVNWFKMNAMVANPDKFQFLLVGVKSFAEQYVLVGDVKVFASESVKLLGVHIDKDLKFDKHIRLICSRAKNKCFALSRIRTFLNVQNARLMYNAFIMSNFSYCPLIWMFCSKTNNNLINSVHKKALRIVYNKYDLSLNQLLEIDNGCSIHLRNLRFLMVEVYKSLNKLNPEFMWDLFSLKNISVRLRCNKILKLPISSSKHKCTNTIVYRACSLWNSLNNDTMNASNLSIFKSSLKSWSGAKCFCKLCK